MDVRLCELDIPSFKRVVLAIIQRVGLNTPKLANLIRSLADGNILFFCDGAIGAGKSTIVEYISQTFSDIVPYPQPIEKIREITKPYYGSNSVTRTFEETNNAIQSLCRDQWLIPLQSATDIYSMAVEHIPPPFHTWIFEKLAK